MSKIYIYFDGFNKYKTRRTGRGSSDEFTRRIWLVDPDVTAALASQWPARLDSNQTSAFASGEPGACETRIYYEGIVAHLYSFVNR